MFEDAGSALCRFLARDGRVVNLEEYRSFPGRYESIAMPSWLESAPVRRSPSVVLLRTAYDVRAVLEGDSAQTPAQRDTYLAVTWISGAPHILELIAEVFDVLAALEDWSALDGQSGAEELMADLARSGLLEMRR